jgi:hypothetical protein
MAVIRDVAPVSFGVVIASTGSHCDQLNNGTRQYMDGKHLRLVKGGD